MIYSRVFAVNLSPSTPGLFRQFLETGTQLVEPRVRQSVSSAARDEYTVVGNEYR